MDTDENILKQLSILGKRLDRIEDFLGNFSPFQHTDEIDSFYDEAVKLVQQHDKASASLLQRRMAIGYARAARILDQLEENGIVGPALGAAPREVIKNK